jgi:hypothetical protein
MPRWDYFSFLLSGARIDSLARYNSGKLLTYTTQVQRNPNISGMVRGALLPILICGLLRNATGASGVRLPVPEFPFCVRMLFFSFFSFYIYVFPFAP